MSRAKSITQGNTYGAEDPFDVFIRWIIYLVVFSLPLVIFPWQADVFSLAKVTALRVAALLIVSAWLLKHLIRREVTWRRSFLDVPIVVFLLTLVASTVLSVNPTTSMFAALYQRHETFPTWVAYLVLFFAASNFLRSKEDLLRLLRVVALTAGIISIYAALQSFGYDLFAYETVGFARLRAIATLGNPVSLGAYLTVAFPLLLALSLVLKGRERVIWATFAFLAAAALVFTYSRGSWLGAAVGLVSFAVLVFASTYSGSAASLRSCLVAVFAVLGLSLPLVIFTVNYLGARAGALISVAILIPLLLLVGLRNFALSAMKQLALLLLIVTVAATLAVIVSQTRSATSGLLVERVETATRGVAGGAGRFPMWGGTLDLVRLRPLFGWGLETLKDFFSYYDTEFVAVEGEKVVDRPHNQLLYIAYSAGAFGLLSYLWILLTFFAGVFSLRSLKGSLAILISGIFASAMGYYTQEQFFFSVVGVTPVVWVLMGAGATLNQRSHRIWRKQFGFSQAFQIAASLILALIVLFLLASSIRFPLADYFYRTGQKQEARGDFRGGNLYLYRAVRTNPWESRYRFAYGQNLEALAMGARDADWLKKGLPVFLDGLKQNPRDYDLHFGLGNIYYRYAFLKGGLSYHEAKSSYARAIQLRPFNPEPYFWLGLAYLQEGRYVAGIGHLKKALELGPGEYGRAPTLFALAQGYEKTGKRELAVRYLEQALEENPNFQVAREMLERLKSKE